MHDLRIDRNDADYQLDLNKYRDSHQAISAFIKARTAYSSFQKSIANKETRSKIIYGVEKYKKNTNN